MQNFRSQFQALFVGAVVLFSGSALAEELKYYRTQDAVKRFVRFLDTEYEKEVKQDVGGPYVRRDYINAMFFPSPGELEKGSRWSAKLPKHMMPWLSYNGVLLDGGLCERWQYQPTEVPLFVETVINEYTGRPYTRWVNPGGWPAIKKDVSSLSISRRNKLSPMEKLCFTLDEPQMCLNEYKERGPISSYSGKKNPSYSGFCNGARSASRRVDEPKCPIAVADEAGVVTYFQPNDIKMMLSAAIGTLHPNLQIGGVPLDLATGIEVQNEIYWPSVVVVDVGLRLGVVNPHLPVVVDNFMGSSSAPYNKALISTDRRISPARDIEQSEVEQLFDQLRDDSNSYNVQRFNRELRERNFLAQDVVTEIQLLDSVSPSVANRAPGDREDIYQRQTYSVTIAYTLYFSRMQHNQYVGGCFRPNRPGSRCFEAADFKRRDSEGSITEKIKMITFSFGTFGNQDRYNQTLNYLVQLGMTPKFCRENRSRLTSEQKTACHQFESVDHLEERYFVQSVLKMAEYSSYVYSEADNNCRQDTKPLDLKESIRTRPIEVVGTKIKFVKSSVEDRATRAGVDEMQKLFVFRNDLPDLDPVKDSKASYQEGNNDARDPGVVQSVPSRQSAEPSPRAESSPSSPSTGPIVRGEQQTLPQRPASPSDETMGPSVPRRRR